MLTVFLLPWLKTENSSEMTTVQALNLTIAVETYCCIRHAVTVYHHCHLIQRYSQPLKGPGSACLPLAYHFEWFFLSPYQSLLDRFSVHNEDRASFHFRQVSGRSVEVLTNSTTQLVVFSPAYHLCDSVSLAVSSASGAYRL